MTNDPIERLRKHVEFHKGNERAMFSVAGLTALLDLLRSLREDNHDLARQRDEAKQTLSDWTTDIGVRGFARRSELDAAKAEVEKLTKQRDELKAQVERLLGKEGERIGKALVK